MAFDDSIDFKQINFREHPEQYRVGKGEQGVLLVKPYKSEILPHWRFKTPEIARIPADKIYQLFQEYKVQGDFIGMDMARKFCKWGIRDRAATPIINLDANTEPTEPCYPVKKIQLKQSLQLSFTKNGSLQNSI